MRVSTLFANADSVTQTDARMAPTTVTVRQPHRFTNELDIGPEIRKSTAFSFNVYELIVGFTIN